MKPIAIAVLLLPTLVACERADPPVKQLERAAEELVTEVEGEQLPRQADGPYAPRDECTDQPGASEFLNQLRSAVSARDAAAFAELAAVDIRLDFGGGAGKALLVERLTASDEDLWGEAEEILSLGCASDGATLTMPWYFAQDTGLDPFEGAIVTGENIPVRTAPNGEAPVAGRLSWAAVRRTGGYDPDAEWMAINWVDEETDEEMSGHIRQENLRGIVDYRIGAARRNDRWRMTYFIAGD